MPAKKQPKKPASAKSTPVASLKHKDKRTNIPTGELSRFVAQDERKPGVVLYPRDPSLDPQLVWKGKDGQDAADLAVPAVPVYIQEKIQPQAIIENLRAQAKRGRPAQAEQLALFADFNGIEFEDLIDFYHHEQHWSNRMILGDSLLVMTSLAEKEGLKGKVQMIYLDPPYGIKFGSNWQVSTRKRDVKDGKAEDATRQPEQVKAFRDTWELGIHSYLAYLRDRLVVARELLTESGSVFVQIGDENEHLVRSLMDEVLGSENFVALITFAKTSGATGTLLPGTADYLLWYGKDTARTKYRSVFLEKSLGEQGAEMYNRLQLQDGSRRTMTAEERQDYVDLPAGARVFGVGDMTSQRQDRPAGPGSAMYFPVVFEGESFYPSGNRGWTTTAEGMRRVVLAGRAERVGSLLRYVRFIEDYPVFPLTNVWRDTGIAGYAEAKTYVVQTNPKVPERCLLMTTDPGDLVLDPTCGSGTTAYVAEQWGRRWITIDTSRVALALARTRLMAARYPYYLLADSMDGQRKEAELSGQLPQEGPSGGDIKRGFVYKRVPHITLKSIANDAEIDAIHARWQEQLEPIHAQLNKLLKQSWKEWEIPREPEPKWPAKACTLLEQYWDLRSLRQREIDASIARHADTELLYDQPYEDTKRIRVSGPFTVESLSPHRVLSTDKERPTSESEGDGATGGHFEATIIENLKKAGVQNTRKQERLSFDRLEPYAGRWLQAAGEYTDASGKTRPVAISIGPEHGTVGSDQIREAAKEATLGVGFDLLVVCGFAFDPHAGETVKEFAPKGVEPGSFAVVKGTRQYGKLPVMLAHMNPDLAMGDELLKKTGAGNLFMVFGEPDLEVKTLRDGKLVVTLKGVDVYDPTTGEIRSSSTDDTACWFIDTDYNGESFFVRHAYFTGAGDPYDKLKRALRAEIDEAAWSALYATKSLPFEPPSKGKIAVKVINHYGDEVLKVYEVA